MKVYVVYWSGEHEDWPLAIFRDEEIAKAMVTIKNTSLCSMREVSFDEAIEWFKLNEE
jgi:hypothetical protein